MRPLWLALALVLSACGSPGAVLVPVSVPARVPVGVFPSIWVVGGSSEDENFLLDQLAVQLAKEPRREVRRLSAEQLASARAAGQVSSLTAVVTLELRLRSGTRQVQDQVPVQYCSMYGCSLQYQTYIENVTELAGEVQLKVNDGPSGRALQADRSQQTVIGDHEDVMHTTLLDRLAHQLTSALEIGQASERFELERVKPKQARAGVALLARGALEPGREQLEQAVQALGGMHAQQQASVWYDLGVARFVAPGPEGLTPAALDAAERAFSSAQRLAPSARHQSGLGRVTETRRRQALLVEQERAKQYNFGLTTY